MIPPGVAIPLHSHAEEERFYIISGEIEIYLESKWETAKAGDFVEILGGIRHGLRNRSNQPALVLVQTTVRLGRFFREMGKPLSFEADHAQPTPEALEHLLAHSEEVQLLAGDAGRKRRNRHYALAHPYDFIETDSSMRRGCQASAA